VRKILTLALPVLLALAGAQAAAQSTVYVWTDENGVRQYTQSPPSGREYQAMRVGAAGQREARGPQADADAATAGEGAGAGQAAPDPAAELERQEYCEAARRNLQALATGQDAVLRTDDGQETELDAEQRAEQVAIAERQVTLFCRD